MSRYLVKQASPAELARWDDYVLACEEATVFHRLAFLSYHGDRFAGQERYLVWIKGESLAGVMPMAVREDGGELFARSPYGGSYGGPVFLRALRYSEAMSAVEGLVTYLTECGIDRCLLTLPLACSARVHSDTFSLALLEHGFVCSRRDISSVVPLEAPALVEERMTSRARNMIRKSVRAGVSATHRADLNDFWAVMEKGFAKHAATPTHSHAEFAWLTKRFPREVYADVAYLDDHPIAGVGYIATNERVNASFYFCQDPAFDHLQGLSLLIGSGLERSQAEGFAWYDFGTSSVHMRGRENIFRFKESFGAVGMFRDTYAWSRPGAGVGFSEEQR